MPEILIFIDGNKSLMNKIKIIIYEKSLSDRRDPNLCLLSQFSSNLIFVGVGIMWFNIAFIISLFWKKNLILKRKIF